MSRVLGFISQRLISFLPNELTPSELGQLLTPRQHSMLLSQRRATMIVNRVRLFAMLFAVLTPLWGFVDVLVFDSPLWIKLAFLRVLTSAAFAAVLVFYRPSGRLLDAYRAMAVLFIIPTLFYIASHLLLAGQALDGFSSAVATGYAFLPFVRWQVNNFPLSDRNVVRHCVVNCARLANIKLVYINWPSFAVVWLLI